MSWKTTYVFKPRSRDRETLRKISIHALERETVETSDDCGAIRVMGGDLLTMARDRGSHVLAWLDGRKTLVMVDKADLKEVSL